MFFGGFCWFWQGKHKYPRVSPKYFESGSLFRIFHVYCFFSGNQIFMEKCWIYCRKCCQKQGHTSVLCLDWGIHLTFSTVFSTVNPIFLHDDLISRKKMVYMKNAEERVGCKTFWKKSWKFTSSLSKSTKTIEKLRKLFTVWFPKELTMSGYGIFRTCSDPAKQSRRSWFPFFSAVTQWIFMNFFWNPLESSRASSARNGKDF